MPPRFRIMSPRPTPRVSPSTDQIVTELRLSKAKQTACEPQCDYSGQACRHETRKRPSRLRLGALHSLLEYLRCRPNIVFALPEFETLRIIRCEVPIAVNSRTE